MATGNLSKDMLKTEDAFIVDNETEIFVWVGKGVSLTERREGMLRGVQYVAWWETAAQRLRPIRPPARPASARSSSGRPPASASLGQLWPIGRCVSGRRTPPRPCVSHHAGAEVIIHGLKGRPELNGQRGRALKWNPEASRIGVELGDGMGKLSVRAENVRLPRAGDPPSQVTVL